jgi:hypothetical protein
MVWRTMDTKLLERVETKLDLIIDLLQDKTLTREEVALLKETDEIVKSKKYQKLVKL